MKSDLTLKIKQVTVVMNIAVYLRKRSLLTLINQAPEILAYIAEQLKRLEEQK